MRFVDYLFLFLAAGLVVAGFTLAWLPLGFVSAGLAAGACWYWLVDSDGDA